MNEVFKEENAYLQDAKKEIEKAIKYYKKEMLELPKKYNNVLQGDNFFVEGMMSQYGTKLKKVELSKDNPYFGRIDFYSDDTHEEAKIYIGKTNVTNENNEQVIVDWRAPICSLYYDSELGKVSFDAPLGIVEGELKLKRQIVIKDSELIDVLDTTLTSNDELLKPYLSVNADNKMKTIIASIQKEQNNIIRRPLEENIIVQGVAGSGKTSVALHRIAYLVYNLSEKIQTRQFLVIGPNKHFLDYISSILPELETEPVEQITLLELFNKLSNEKITLEENLNSDSNISKFKTSFKFRDLLEKYINNFLESGIVKESFLIEGEEVFSLKEINEMLINGNYKKISVEDTCKYFVNKFKNNMDSIYEKLNQKYKTIYMSLPFDSPEREAAIEKSDQLKKIVKEKGVQLIKQYFKNIKTNPTFIYTNFISNLYGIKVDGLSESDVLKMQKETLTNLNKKKVMLEDLAPLMYIHFLMNGECKTYNHIVVDEAQDYGLFQFYVLKQLFTNSTFSIYGDIAQSINFDRSIENWESVVNNVFNNECKVLKLNKSYRTTIEITNNANKVLECLDLNNAEPVIRHGNDITYNDLSKNNEYKINKILDWINFGYKSVAIICKDIKEASNLYKQLKKYNVDITLLDEKSNKYNGGICITTSLLSKGLEFDAVMINDASAKVYDVNSKKDMHLLYVACTRALHELEILYDSKLTEVFNNKKDLCNDSKKLVKKI